MARKERSACAARRRRLVGDEDAEDALARHAGRCRPRVEGVGASLVSSGARRHRSLAARRDRSSFDVGRSRRLHRKLRRTAPTLGGVERASTLVYAVRAGKLRGAFEVGVRLEGVVDDLGDLALRTAGPLCGLHHEEHVLVVCFLLLP